MKLSIVRVERLKLRKGFINNIQMNIKMAISTNFKKRRIFFNYYFLKKSDEKDNLHER
jgi:hypothetical protein